MKNKILFWLANGKTGVSSESMAFAVLGIPKNDCFGNMTPSDPSDFNRCLLLLESVPEIRDNFDKIAALDKEWNKMIENWDEIEKCFLDEVGFNWSKSNSAPKTYELMQDLS